MNSTEPARQYKPPAKTCETCHLSTSGPWLQHCNYPPTSACSTLGTEDSTLVVSGRLVAPQTPCSSP